MNNKLNFVTDVLAGLSYRFTQSELQLIQMELNKQLDKYGLVLLEKNEIVAVDDYNDELIKRYIIKKKLSGIADKTLSQYIRETKKFLLAMNKRACDITTQDIENYLITYKYKNNISNTTLCNMKCFINNFFDFLFVEEIISRNPFAKVSKIKCDTIKDKAISKVEEEKLYENCDLRGRAIIETLLATGCRVGELVNIKLSDINFYNKTINVIGKGHKQRMVCISDKAIYHLQKYLDERRGNSEYLFTKKNKPYTQISIDGVESILRKVGKKSNIGNIYPHRLRSTFCTRLIDVGMNLHQVQKLMGHSKIDTTMIYYRGDYNLCSDYNKLTNI